MVIAVLDVLLTLLLPLLLGAAITGSSPSGAWFTRRPAHDLLGRRRVDPVRAIPLLLPLLWQPVVSTYLLVERLIGVLVLAAAGMALGKIGRATSRRLFPPRSGS
ncbi:hypothetical protein ACH4TS_20340 [Streptomyces albidoflavus]|uniref:hypothetical protein n=1 Tax=Streptomyces sp. B29(2018) TaxID=2485016 RepID=UPI000FD69253|nr:hypothetical protein [Streptomyces sp. B29(2018)]